MPAGGGEHVAHVAHTDLRIDVEPHLRELDGDIRVKLCGRDPVEHADDLVPRALRLSFVVDALSEEIQAGTDSVGVEGTHRGDRSVERLSGHEPSGELF